MKGTATPNDEEHRRERLRCESRLLAQWALLPDYLTDEIVKRLPSAEAAFVESMNREERDTLTEIILDHDRSTGSDGLEWAVAHWPGIRARIEAARGWA